MKMNRNGMRTMVLAACTMAAGALPVMMAQEPMAPPPPQGEQQGPSGPHGHRDPAQMEARQLQMMTERLKLTPDQVTQVKAIEDGQRTQMTAMRQDTSVPQEQKREKMRSMRQETESKVRDVLTDEQKPKFDQMLAKQRERMEHREGGPGGPPSAPAAPPQ